MPPSPLQPLPYSINVTVMPTLGTLQQIDFLSPALDGVPINTSNVAVRNALGVVRYAPGRTGKDSFQFTVSHGGLVSAPATVHLDVSAWNDPPRIPPAWKKVAVTAHQATSISLPVYDTTSGQYVAVFITSLPTKGILYQRNRDGSLGAPITQAFGTGGVTTNVKVQYATGVANVSSFWGGSVAYSPLQALGPQNCFEAVDCQLAWCTATKNGLGGFASGSGQGLHYANNPSLNYVNYGWTEYIELTYDTPVLMTAVLIGENRGMGAVKNILAMDPYGNWMTVWTSSVPIRSDIQNHYSLYQQYRIFAPPDLCQTMFLTKHLRFEMDTRDTSDWHEVRD